jgi:poly(ADP-ribose) glycohydrolase ARH3
MLPNTNPECNHCKAEHRRIKSMEFSQDQFKGCLLGLALGDALGAPYEGGIVERCVWRLIGRTRDGRARWTDDTQMALDLAESLLDQGGLNEQDLATRFARSYSWSRGYGPGTARLLRRIRRGQDWASAARAVHPEGSYGNGAAMRSPVLALFFTHDLEVLIRTTQASAQVTHAHPLGIAGAILISTATHGLLWRRSLEDAISTVRRHCQAPEMLGRLSIASSWLSEKAAPTPKEVSTRLGNGMTAVASCVTALYIALRYIHCDFNEMMRFIIACRGDVDTVGAMAGGLWGVFNGSVGLPSIALEGRSLLEDTASRLFGAASAFHPG